MSSKPTYTLHFTPADYFSQLDPEQDYLPPHFADEGFIHTTEGSENLVAVGNRYYKDDPGDFLVLYIDKARVKSPVRYDDPDEIYPHIYGPLNRDAIVAVRRVPRNSDGSFLPVPESPG
jgi:uncharacterized protein (DUF952 family)